MLGEIANGKIGWVAWLLVTEGDSHSQSVAEGNRKVLWSSGGDGDGRPVPQLHPSKSHPSRLAPREHTGSGRIGRIR
jgi:hypothetical protein